MFNEALQDLKDKYKNRLTLIHILSRQAQEMPLLPSRIDAAKVRQLIDTLLPARSMDEVFVCGPEAMIENRAGALSRPACRPIPHLQRALHITLAGKAQHRRTPRRHCSTATGGPTGQVALVVVVDGRAHEMSMRPTTSTCSTSPLSAGLDLPYPPAKGGVCCTCRAKKCWKPDHHGQNFTLEAEEMAQGFVLSCQARPTGDKLVVSYDDEVKGHPLVADASRCSPPEAAALRPVQGLRRADLEPQASALLSSGRGQRRWPVQAGQGVRPLGLLRGHRTVDSAEAEPRRCVATAGLQPFGLPPMFDGSRQLSEYSFQVSCGPTLREAGAPNGRGACRSGRRGAGFARHWRCPRPRRSGGRRVSASGEY